MVWSPLANGTSGNANRYSSRNGARIDRFIPHHAAQTNWSALLATFAGGDHSVSPTYAIGRGNVFGIVPEELRPWTSSSASWDGRALTVEVLNSSAQGWLVADEDFHNLARVIADWSIRYNNPINDDTVITHQELSIRYGASYQTACPGSLQARKAELLALAIKYASGTATPTPEVKPNILEDEPMYIAFIDKFGHYLITPSYVRKIEKKGTITAIEKITGRGVTVLPFAEFYETWTDINAANLSDTALAGTDEIEELAKKLGL